MEYKEYEKKLDALDKALRRHEKTMRVAWAGFVIFWVLVVVIKIIQIAT